MVTHSPEVAERTGDEIGRALRTVGRLDGVIQMGSTFTLPEDVRYVTFEDVTVAQALRVRDLPREWAEVWRQRQAEVYARAVACCVASDWAGHSVRKDYGVPRRKVRVVGFGANLEFKPQSQTGFEPPRFLFVGRGWERKNGPAVLQAFCTVRREFPAATLDLVSDHPEIDQPGVRGHDVLFPPPSTSDPMAGGHVSLRDLFEHATCFVMPSCFEPFGIVYVEAGTAGVPSIGTKVGGAADAIGAGGVLVDPEDDTALREAMLALCAPETARRLGRLARRNAARYSWPLVARRVLEALLP
jgi:glycosyltransferase involved in cell wall biosynthesis